MKKLVLLLLLACLVGCTSGKSFVYHDDELAKFDKVLENIGDGHTKAYDLRSEEDCLLGRIPGFFCMRTIDSSNNEKSLDTIFEHLSLLIGNDYAYLIILMDADGIDSAYLAGLLVDAGYRNVHYFASGYARYVYLKGDSFVPEVGPCENC